MPSIRFFASVAALALALPALAVDRLVPSQYATIQAAIDASSDGDQILVSAGGYVQQINLGGKKVVLRAVAGPSQTTISPGGAAGSIITCSGGESNLTVIEGFTIFGSNGPGISIVSAGPVFRNCRIIQNYNSSSDGGGVAISGSGGSPRFEDCLFTGNRAIGRHGGAMSLAAAGGTVTLVRCSLASNQATAMRGGAIFSSGVNLVIQDCSFASNGVLTCNNDVRGGAIAAHGGVLTITSSTFQGNEAYVWECGCCGDTTATGGAIFSTGNVTITNCVFGENVANAADARYTARAWGGAIHAETGITLTISGSQFLANRAVASNNDGRESRGGAVALTSGADPYISNCMFSGNYASSSGNAYSAGGTLWYGSGAVGWLRDSSIMASSVFTEGGGIFVEGGAAPHLQRVHLSNCFASGSNGGGIRLQEANAFLDEVRFSNCASPNGGAVYTRNCQPYLEDCVFDANTSSVGSAIRTEGSGIANVPTLASNYFCGNSGNSANWIVGSWNNPQPGSNVFLATCGDDCNINGIPDGFEIANGLATDCDSNGQPDSCQPDCDGDQVPNVCEADCNANGLADVCEIQSGGGIDCNANGQLDACEIASGAVGDCDGDGIPNPCETDCDSDGQADPCEILAGAADCDSDGIPDSCQIASGDRNNDGVYDDCQTVAFENLEVEIKPIVGSISGLPSTAVCWRVYAKLSAANASVTGIFGDTSDPLSIQATGGFYQSPSGANVASDIPCTGGGPTVAYDSYLTIGGECANEVDVVVTGIDFTAFNANGGISSTNGIAFVTPGAPASLAGKDRRVLLMQLTSKTGVKPTTSFNLIGDNADGTEWFAYALPLPNPTLVDCNANGTHDALDISTGTSRDCNRSGVPDECEYANANADCDADGTIDLCEIFAGAEIDLNNNGIPDDCECLGDVTGDNAVNVYDVIAVIVAWGDPNPGAADLNGDGVANGLDLSLVLTGWGYCL